MAARIACARRVPTPPADRNLLPVGFRLILVIPHLVALWSLGIVVTVVTVTAFFVVPFTGRWPEGMRHLVVNVVRWYLRVQTYLLLLTDTYPPLSLDAQTP